MKHVGIDSTVDLADAVTGDSDRSDFAWGTDDSEAIHGTM